MIRRLQHATLAATASAFLLAFALVAAAPITAPQDSPRDAAASVASAAPPSPIASVARTDTASGRRSDDGRATQLRARIDPRASAFEARMARSAPGSSVGDSVASAVAFAAEISTEVALTSALGALQGSAANVEQALDSDDEEDRRRHARRIRTALAVPYFSFAQGLRGAGS